MTDVPISDSDDVIVAGAGPVGCLLATLLARRGLDVRVLEKRPDMRRADIGGERSINLVLTERGLQALERVDLREKVLRMTVPVRGRMIHDETDDQPTFQPYGKHRSECNYSVSRSRLNEFLLDVAQQAGADLYFEHEVVDADFRSQTLDIRTAAQKSDKSFEFDVLFGSDGAPSAIRSALVERRDFRESVQFMDWGYKELVFPAGDDGDWTLDENALHIWPRNNHFLMGLANPDGSFTGTLYLDRQGGEPSFETIEDAPSVREFFDEYYPGAAELLGDYVETFLDRPVGTLGTVRTDPWYLADQAVLVGDAAHGIVPFFGQGLNSGFEDCVLLEDLLEVYDNLGTAFDSFYHQRKPDTEAIADMALENAREMGDKVADSRFLLQKQIESVIEEHLDDIYRSRYAMVMYSTIPYRVAYQAGEAQKEILAELAADVDDADQVDLDEARELIERELTPILERHGVDLDF